VGSHLFVAPFEGGMWATPEPLPEPLNSPHDEGDPFIAPDRSFLLFASNREGNWNLYVSYREGEAWGEVQKLGDEVNTRADERAPLSVLRRRPSSSSGMESSGPSPLPGLGWSAPSPNPMPELLILLLILPRS
jgi:hypothetical protein